MNQEIQERIEYPTSTLNVIIDLKLHAEKLCVVYCEAHTELTA